MPFLLLLLGWTASRWLLVKQTYGPQRWIFGDVHYYFSELANEKQGGEALKEYPEANLWLLRVIDLFAPDNQASIEQYYVGFILSLDLLFFALLIHRKHYLAGIFWVLFGFVVGPIFLTRLDLVPGLLVGVFAYLLARHPKVSAAFLAAATMMKLWPGVLAASLVGHWKSKQSWLRIGVFVGSMAAMALVTITTQGFDRLLSPLDYQAERGLQIESIAATPFIVLAATGGGGYQIRYAASKSFEITGPGVDTATSVASAALYLTVLLAAAVVLRRLFRHTWRSSEAIALAMVLIVAVLVTNKVFSPQYMVWLAPITAVILCFTPNRLAKINAVVVLAITWLTQYVYPGNYDSLMTNDPDFMPTLALATRNILMVVLLVLTVLWWRREATAPVPALDDQASEASTRVN
ncbi:hypothetical protein CKALI_00950 [Corynebacterium kalinowskii]|uniref:DUF2029 domain-containing protein n=1 Tax=Corynebacterium kalinowskii TaxID=2675216 RepID=A0A6B8VMW2_9CORY|nr:glycosyltransferase 87 family protein [Corynebacterium kalinowskii]QGU01091.1 hypothetical protein CKALI_00950 [Corynebacterium kalinowskii]